MDGLYWEGQDGIGQYVNGFARVITYEVIEPQFNPDQLDAILDEGGAEAAPLRITLVWDTDVNMDLSFNCNDDADAINQDNREGYNVCGARLDVYEEDRDDGSFGNIENISIDTPIDGVTYTGEITHLSEDATEVVEYTLIYSGQDDEGNAVILDYM